MTDGEVHESDQRVGRAKVNADDFLAGPRRSRLKSSFLISQPSTSPVRRCGDNWRSPRRRGSGHTGAMQNARMRVSILARLASVASSWARNSSSSSAPIESSMARNLCAPLQAEGRHRASPDFSSSSFMFSSKTSSSNSGGTSFDVHGLKAVFTQHVFGAADGSLRIL